MNKRKFGKTNRMVSEIGLGTWQLGTKQGDPFNEKEALRILETTSDCGINLIDTADIYNDGNSEITIGKFLKTHKDNFFIVTKCGRRVKKLFKTDNLAPYALRWILMFNEVSCVIPGASNAKQVLNNVEASKLPAFTEDQMSAVSAVYEKYIKNSVHLNW